MVTSTDAATGCRRTRSVAASDSSVRDQSAAQLWQRAGRPGQAARVHMLKRKDPAAAAEALRAAGQFQRAAEIYRKAGDISQAAVMFELGGLKLDAAKLHEQMGNLARAARLHEELGDPGKASELRLLRSGSVAERRRIKECFQGRMPGFFWRSQNGRT